MNLTALAFRFDRVVIILVVLLLMSGISAYFDLPKAQTPDFIIRTAVITTYFPGASPERVEALVTDRIEKAVQELPELDNVTSKSQTGVSLVFANFQESYRHMQPIFDRLRRKVEGVVSDLPQDASEPIVDDEYGDVFGTVYALTGDGFDFAELKDIADDIRDELLKIPDIAKVEIQGAQDEVIFVEYNNSRLTELDLSPQQLSQILGSANILQSGGAIRIDRERITLEPSGNFERLEDLRKTVIQLPGRSDVVYLDDIAEIYRDYRDPPRDRAHIDGESALIISIAMRKGGNIMDLDQTLQTVIPQLINDYPWGIDLQPVYYQPQLVAASIDNFMSNLLQAVAIVMLVMVCFLGIRTGLIVAALIPMTIVVTFVLMKSLGISLNEVSLAALIIALGLLVDNAIVVMESIQVRMLQGLSAMQAAIESGTELAVPLLISSLTTAAAFLSIFLAESTVGEFTADIFKVNALALLSSWVLAMTAIPIMSHFVLGTSGKATKKQNGQHDEDSLIQRRYHALLLKALKRPWICLVLILVLFVVAIRGLGFVPKVFIPERTDPVIHAKFNMPRGTAIETTEAMINDIEQFMRDTLVVNQQASDSAQDGIVHWASFIGKGTPRYTLSTNPDPVNAHHSSMIITTSDHGVIPDVIASMQDYTRQHFPDLKVQMQQLQNGESIDFPVAIRVSGDAFDELYAIIEPIKHYLLSLPEVQDVEDDWGARSKKLLIDVDQDRARRSGVTSQDVAVSLQAGMSGLDLTQFREDDKLIPVTLRSVAADREDIGKLDGMSIYSESTGNAVPLKQVADIKMAWQYGIIKRRDRDRTITVNAQLKPGVTATEVTSKLLPWLEKDAEQWPRGYSYELGGESESSGDANASIAEKLPISGMIIILLLVAQFNSIRKPVIILTTIPLGLIGVTIGLLVAQSIFGFFTILGIISLSGIIINNAIVLIDRIEIELENGMSPPDAIISAARQRLRPILLTTATTIGGMLPLWLSHDPMFETMAVTIIFGLAFATLLTLVLVPVLYSLFYRVKFIADG